MNHKPLYHPHIVRFEEVFLLKHHLCVVMEYASGGSLKHFLQCFPNPMYENTVRFYFQQLILTVDYCHRKDICHRDIKLENLCLSGEENRVLMLVDFGYANVPPPINTLHQPIHVVELPVAVSTQ